MPKALDDEHGSKKNYVKEVSHEKKDCTWKCRAGFGCLGGINGRIHGVSYRTYSGRKKEPVRLGVTLDQTGPFGVHGEPLIRGITACIQRVNKTGGVLGRPVETIILDEKSSPEQAVKNARDLIYTKNVDLIIEGINSAACQAASEVCKSAKVPLLINGQPTPLTHRYVFRAIATSAAQSYGCAWYINKYWPDKKKIYVLAHDYLFGRWVSGDFMKRLQKFNPNTVLIGESWVKVGETDYSPYIARLRSVKPDVAFTPWAAASTFVRQATPTGVFKEVQVITPSWVLGELMDWPKADIPEGMVMDGTPWYAIDTPENSAFVNMIKELYNRPPNSCEYFGYVSTLFAIEAIKKAKTTNKEKIVDALEGLTLSTPVGPVTIRDFDHQSTYPYFLGRVTWSDKYGHGIIEGVERISAEKFLPTKAEVEAARKESK